MKNLLQNLLQSTTNLLQYRFTKPLYCPEQMPIPVIEKTAGEKLYEFCMQYYNTDPTPKDEVEDQFSCVWSLTLILQKFFDGEFKNIDYTPELVKLLKNDNRFKLSNEFKTGSLVVFPTLSGNGKVIGHCFIVGKNGKMLSNSSATGWWTDKYDTITMIERYVKLGQLDMYIFELK